MGKPKGYAFIYMNNKIDADNAIKNLNRKKIRGKTIVVKYSHEGNSNSCNSSSNNSKKNIIDVDNNGKRSRSEFDNVNNDIKNNNSQLEFNYNDISMKSNKINEQMKKVKAALASLEN
jgi:RNA recognition motif-containing protein